MPDDQAESDFEDPFNPSLNGSVLLDALRDDLKNAFPKLDDPESILRQAVADLRDGGRPKMDVDGPSLRLRDEAAPRYDRPCVPPEARVEGWFANHAMRHARVRDHVRSIAAARDGTEPAPCPGMIEFIFRKHSYNLSLCEDAFQDACRNAIRGARNYDCRRPFCPWFARILKRALIDGYRNAPGFEPVDDVPGDHPGQHPNRSPAFSEYLDLAIEDGIPIPPELFETAAKLELERLGIRFPSPELLKRWANYLERLHAERLRRAVDAPDPENLVPLNLYELYVALGSIGDLRRELPPNAEPTASALEDVLRGMEAIVVFQEAKDRGNASWPSDPNGPRGPVDQLNRVQTRAWGLLDGRNRSESGTAWRAARIVHWFAWRMKAAAFLAAALRYAGRLKNEVESPDLAALENELLPLDCLSAFPKQLRERLSPRQNGLADLWKAESAPPSPERSAAALLLFLAVRRTAPRLNRPATDAIDGEFPDLDWLCWTDHVAGRGSPPLEPVRRLAESTERHYKAPKGR